MWFKFLLFTFVGLATGGYGWENGQEYHYILRSLTISGLHQVANKFSGIFIKGQTIVQPKSDDILSIRVPSLRQALVHANLSDTWPTYIDEENLKFQSIPLTNKQFVLKLKNGIFDKMYVDQNLGTWEVNLLKAIASQFQVDTLARNLKRSRMNHVPVEGQARGVYKTVEEDTITGECETFYNVFPLPQHVLQSLPELVPLPHLKGDGQFIDIVKTKNYSNCDQRIAYQYGFTGLTDWEPFSNHMGSFLTRSSVSRIILSGSLKRYTVQSSVTTNKIILSPNFYNNQKGIVASRMNLTLQAVQQSSESPQPVSKPRTIKNLAYLYNAATQEAASAVLDNFSSSSSSSSSSSEESQQHNQKGKRMKWSRRSVIKQKETPSDDTSESSSSSDSSSSSSSSSTSNSEEFWQPKPKLSKTSNIPFMPYFVRYQGNSSEASDKIDGVSAAYKLAKQIAAEL